MLCLQQSSKPVALVSSTSAGKRKYMIMKLLPQQQGPGAIMGPGMLERELGPLGPGRG